jgi:hypothetical protein
MPSRPEVTAGRFSRLLFYGPHEYIQTTEVLGMANVKSTLKRAIHPMPDFVEKALLLNNVMAAFRDRPAYQRNDYLGWIARAARDATKSKRLAQMNVELKTGGVYMKMTHPPSEKEGRSSLWKKST